MNPEDDGRGALTAALEYDPYSNVHVLGYRYLDDETFTKKQQEKMKTDSSAREAFNVHTDDEVRVAIYNALENIGKHID
jgi:hypothetical protein